MEIVRLIVYAGTCCRIGLSLIGSRHWLEEASFVLKVLRRRWIPLRSLQMTRGVPSTRRVKQSGIFQAEPLSFSLCSRPLKLLRWGVFHLSKKKPRFVKPRQRWYKWNSSNCFSRFGNWKYWKRDRSILNPTEMTGFSSGFAKWMGHSQMVFPTGTAGLPRKEISEKWLFHLVYNRYYRAFFAPLTT